MSFVDRETWGANAPRAPIPNVRLNERTHVNIHLLYRSPSMIHLQEWHTSQGYPDIAYHFVIDGTTIYEGLGWLLAPEQLQIAIVKAGGSLSDETLTTLGNFLNEADQRCERPLVFNGPEDLFEWRLEQTAHVQPEAPEVFYDDDVAAWQAFLVEMGVIATGEWTPGVWDDATDHATELIRSKFGLPRGGIFGDNTPGWCAGMLSAHRASVPPPQKPDPEPVPLSAFRGLLRLGDCSDATDILNVRLRHLGYTENDGDQLGCFSRFTVKAVRKFQMENHLNPTGYVDWYTWQALWEDEVN